MQLTDFETSSMLLFLLGESQNKFMWRGFPGEISPKSFFSKPIQFMQKPRHTIGRECNEESIDMRHAKFEPYLRAGGLCRLHPETLNLF